QGARAVVPLRITIASHSPLMQQAALQLANVIASLELKDPVTPMMASIQGRILTTAEDIRQHMVTQLELPVEWTHSVREMIVSRAGPGRGPAWCGGKDQPAGARLGAGRRHAGSSLRSGRRWRGAPAVSQFLGRSRLRSTQG